MPRKSSDKPWLHAKSGFWCATVSGKRLYLDKNFQLACRKLVGLRRQQQDGAVATRDWLDAPFAQLADEYLDHVKAFKKSATYTSMRYRLLRALKTLGTTLRVGELKKSHLTSIHRALVDKCSSSTIRDTLAAVQSVMYWAVSEDMIDVNPVVRYAKPPRGRRNRIITPPEFSSLLRHSDVRFRRFLMAMRQTGCRPGELRSLKWDWVDLEQGLWVFHDHKTITQQREAKPRVVPLPRAILLLCRWLAREPHLPTDPVFGNVRGKPYSKNCLVKKMDRIRKRAGIVVKAGEQLVLYSNRHSFATDAVGKVSEIELAELLGHTDSRTTRRYVHLNPAHLKEIRRRVDA